jgi:hypothetical protein
LIYYSRGGDVSGREGVSICRIAEGGRKIDEGRREVALEAA